MDSLRSPAVFGRDIVRRKRFSGATISGNSLSRHVLKTQHFSNEENLNSIRYELKQHNGSQFTTRKRPLRMGNWAFAGKLLTNPLFCQTGTLRPWSQENDFKKVYPKPFGQGFSLVVALEPSRVLAIFCSTVFTSDHPCIESKQCNLNTWVVWNEDCATRNREYSRVLECHHY